MPYKLKKTINGVITYGPIEFDDEYSAITAARELSGLVDGQMIECEVEKAPPQDNASIPYPIRGGARIGAGRKPLPDDQKRIRVQVLLHPSTVAALKTTGKNLSEAVRALVEQHLPPKRKITSPINPGKAVPL